MKPTATRQSATVKRVIAGLSILTGNLQEGRDYIDLFVPLVAHCILSLKPTVISTTDLQRQMESTFGMRIPQNTLKLILHRAAKSKYVSRQDTTYVPNLEAIAGLNFTARYQDVIRQHKATSQSLVKFASDRFDIKLTEAEADNALLAHLQKHDIEILECLINAEKPLAVQPVSTQKLDFIVNSFIIESYENDPKGFEYIDTILKGFFLSRTLFFPDLGRINKRFRKTAVYIDTPILLRILYDTPARQEPCKELVALLYQEGAALRCFRHTREEVNNVLYADMLALSKTDISYISPTLNYFRKGGYTASDIELEMAILDKKIENVGLSIVDKPEYSHQFQVDELKLDKALRDEREYWRDKPRQRKHDVDCLSAIYRLRRGSDSTYVEDSIAVFLTSNSALCKVSAKFFVAEGYVDKGSVPIAVTDYALTSLLWLKTPMTAPDFPAKFIIAECYAAVEPNERLWQKYLEVTTRLKEEAKISENEYYLLRYSPMVHKELMELTMGDEGMITEGAIQEILEASRMEIRREDLVRLEQQRRLIDKEARRWRSLNQNIEKISRRIARCVSIITFIIIMLIISGGAIWGSIYKWGNWWNYVTLVAYLAFLSLSIINLYSGIKIKDWLRRLEVSISKLMRDALKKWFLPPL